MCWHFSNGLSNVIENENAEIELQKQIRAY